MGYSAHLDTINSLEWAERKGVNQAYYPNFTTSWILNCLSQSCTPCTPFFCFIFSTFSPPALSCVLPSSHPVYEWNTRSIRMALGMAAHQIAMGSYWLSFSFGHSSSSSLPSGLTGVDVGGSSCQALPAVPSCGPHYHHAPTLAQPWKLLIWYHELLLLTDVGSGPVTLSVAVDNVFTKLWRRW